MIKSKTQRWEPGATVRIGNLELIVETKIPTPGDGKPDAYSLRSLDRTRTYRFQPYNGLRIIDVEGLESNTVPDLETDSINRNEITAMRIKKHG